MRPLDEYRIEYCFVDVVDVTEDTVAMTVVVAVVSLSHNSYVAVSLDLLRRTASQIGNANRPTHGRQQSANRLTEAGVIHSFIHSFASDQRSISQ